MSNKLMHAVSPGYLPQLARQEKARRQLVAIASVLGRANRIITGSGVSTVVAEVQPNLGYETPGWTDGTTIWLNGPNIRKLLTDKGTDPKTILALKGVNYHELAHVLYSPLGGQEITKRIWRNQQQFAGYWWYAFNILEDLRAEMLFVTDYPPAINFYTNTVSTWITTSANAEADALDDVWPLLAGRLYLSNELRMAARNAFAVKHGTSAAIEVDEIARDYLRLIFPDGTNKGYILVDRLQALLQSQLISQLRPPSGLHTDPQGVRDLGGPDKAMQGNSKDSTWRTKDAAGDLGDFLDALEDDWDDYQKNNSGGSSASSGNESDEVDDDDTDAGNGNGGKDNDADSEGESSQDASGGGADGDTATTQTDGTDGSGESNTPSSEAGGEGVSTNDGNDLLSKAEARSELIDLAEEIAERTASMDSVKEEVRDTMDAVRQKIDKEVRQVDGYSGNYTDVDATPGDKLVVSKVSDHLRELRIDLESVWLANQPSGTIDVKAAMLAQPGDLDIFQVWDEGLEEEASTEVVILMDQSGSMHSRMNHASTAMWMLKRACDENDIVCSVLGYSTEWQILYQPSDKAKSGQVRRFPASGGTEPHDALRQAESILRGSRATNKVLISITDGLWPEDQLIQNALYSLRKSGTRTYMFHLGAASYLGNGGQLMPSTDTNLRYHETGYYVGKIEDVVPIVGSLVTELMREFSINY